MTDAAIRLQEAAIAALAAHPAISVHVSGIFDGPPPRAPFPYIVIADSPVSDWSCKDIEGREIRLAVNIWDDGEIPARLHELVAVTQDALAALPDTLPGWQVASNHFLRSLLTRDPGGPWLALVEQRVRMLCTNN